MTPAEDAKLRLLIREHVLSAAVPDFVMIEALDIVEQKLRFAFEKYIQQYKSHSPEERATAEDAVNVLLAGLKEDVKESFEQRLLDFLQSV